jgi:phthiocerol/phenolphthiocerol synthesis type-I polyketide synthase D
VVISGAGGAVRELVSRATAEGVVAREIAVDFAAHSPAVAAKRAELLAAFGAPACLEPTVPMYSTARPDTALSELTPDAAYWADNACDTVHLHAAMAQAVADGFDSVLEIGPHPMLAHALADAAPGLRSVVAMSHKDDETFAVARCLGELEVHGHQVRRDPGRGRFFSPPRRRWRPTRFGLPTRRTDL